MDAQTALWALPSKLDGIWWLVCAAFALPAATLIVVKMIINEPINLLTTSRVIIAGSLFFFGMTPLNSGFLPWGALLACIGGFLTSVLIATGWCNRPNRNDTVPRALWRWAVGKLHPKGYVLHKDVGD